MRADRWSIVPPKVERVKELPSRAIAEQVSLEIVIGRVGAVDDAAIGRHNRRRAGIVKYATGRCAVGVRSDTCSCSDTATTWRSIRRNLYIAAIAQNAVR